MPLDDKLAFATIAELGSQLRAGGFTCVELTEFFLARAKEWGPKLNAVVTLCAETALKEAKQRDAELQAGTDRGPLHGIPYGAKDLLATRGIPTSWGAAPLKQQIPDDDATVVRRLRSAGAVLIAKLAMVEIAGGFGYRQPNASFTGPGLNPWGSGRWSGGSSSGSGSAVGGGLVPFAIGSETWGSIVTPAGYCGVTGLRPTYGRVSRHGAMALSWTMDKLGPMCHSAEDCGLVLHAIAGPDPADPSASSREYAYPPPKPFAPPFKIATLKGAVERVQEEVQQNYNAAVDLFNGFASLEEIELPELPYGTVAGTLIACEMAAAFEGLVSSGDVWELTAPEDRWGGHANQVIPARDYINAMRIRSRLQREMDRVFENYDAILTPTLSTVAPPIGQDFAAYVRGFTSTQIGAASNVTGLPGLSLPSGFGEDHLPTAIQLTGRAFEENRLLAISKLYQEKTAWHRETPELAKTVN